MKRLFLTLVFATAFIIEPPSAFATPLVDNTCQGAGNCNTDNSTNQTTVVAPVTTSGAISNAEGGDANNVNVISNKAEGGDVYRSGNSDVDVKNRVSTSTRQSQKQGQLQRQSQSVDGSGNSEVSINNPRQPVNTAVAAALTASPEACMGSTSIGAQGVGFGLSIGSTWENDNCQARMDAKTLQALGYDAAARARLCMVEAYRIAFATVGQACPTVATED